MTVSDLDLREKALALHRAMKATEAAYLDDETVPALRQDGDGNAVLCVKTGVAVFLRDEVFEDRKNGQWVLRSALGLPPGPAEDAT